MNWIEAIALSSVLALLLWERRLRYRAVYLKILVDVLAVMALGMSHGAAHTQVRLLSLLAIILGTGFVFLFLLAHTDKLKSGSQ